MILILNINNEWMQPIANSFARKSILRDFIRMLLKKAQWCVFQCLKTWNRYRIKCRDYRLYLSLILSALDLNFISNLYFVFFIFVNTFINFLIEIGFSILPRALSRDENRKLCLQRVVCVPHFSHRFACTRRGKTRHDKGCGMRGPFENCGLSRFSK